MRNNPRCGAHLLLKIKRFEAKILNLWIRDFNLSISSSRRKNISFLVPILPFSDFPGSRAHWQFGPRNNPRCRRTTFLEINLKIAFTESSLRPRCQKKNSMNHRQIVSTNITRKNLFSFLQYSITKILLKADIPRSWVQETILDAGAQHFVKIKPFEAKIPGSRFEIQNIHRQNATNRHEA